MSERLGPYGRRELDVTIHEEPQWWMAAGIAGAIVVTTMAAVTYAGAAAHVDRPLVLATLLALSVGPFVVQLFVTIHPTVCTIWALVALGAVNLLGSPLGIYDAGGHTQLSIMMLVWLMGATAAVAERREIIAVITGALIITIGRQFTDPGYNSGHIWVLGVVIALLAGLFIRSLTVALLNTKLAEIAVKEQATTEERQRIAREVHDVIAHSMTVTMLHLTAARLAVGRGDTAAATEALEEAERAGRTSLTEIRNTVGLLRSDDGDAATAAPQPVAADLTTLVAGYRAAGMDITLAVDGDLDTVDAAAGLAVYRVVQESLTNASRHAPGSHCSVRVSIGPPLRIDVRNNGGTAATEPGSGVGITGMAERIRALGGSFAAGPTEDGWSVEATIA